MNDTGNYNIWLTLVLQHITGDGKYYPALEYRIKTDKTINRLFTSLYDIEIVPGEAFRYLTRCYPEIIEQINNSKIVVV